MNTVTFASIEQHRTGLRDFINWLSRLHFLAIPRDCSRCGLALRLIYSSKRALDHFDLFCPSCRGRESIRTGSIFEAYRLPLATLTQLLVLFANNTTATRASQQLRIARSTVSHFYGMMRNRIAADIEENPILFDRNDILEIDETLIEALRGGEPEQPRTTGWVFGIVSRNTGQVHLEEVPNHEGRTLLRVMAAHVPPHTIVCGDSWRGYNLIASQYTLRTITKGRNDMSYYDEDLEITVHTGTIEGVWSQLRAMLHVSRGYPAHYISLVLAEFMYRKAHRSVFALAEI